MPVDGVFFGDVSQQVVHLIIRARRVHARIRFVALEAAYNHIRL